MSVRSIVCPNCGGRLVGDTTVCPDCQEDLSALARLEYEHAIRYNEALALAQAGDHSGARTRLYQSLAARESFVPALELLARIDARDGRWCEAQESISRALDLQPENGELLELAKDIGAAASEEAADRLRESRLRKERAKHLFASYQRELAGSFLLGMGLVTLLAMLIGWLRGASKGDEEW